MKLYDYKAAFNPRRVRMFLAEKSLEVPKVQIDLMAGEHLQDGFRQINPDATVPVLELDDGLLLTETQAIARYIEGKQPEPCLLGREPEQQAEIEMWQRRIEQWLVGSCANYFHHATSGLGDEGRYRNKDWGEYNRDRAQTGLSRLNEQLEHNRYITGSEFSVADITALCTLDFATAIGIPLTDSHPHLQRWYNDVSQRPSAAA